MHLLQDLNLLNSSSFGAHFTEYGLTVWTAMYQLTLDLSVPFDIVESMPGRCVRQTTRAKPPANSLKQYWKVSLYFAFIDHMIMELESRLISSGNRFYAHYLLPRVVGNTTNEQISALLDTYETGLAYNLSNSIGRSLDGEHECYRGEIVQCTTSVENICMINHEQLQLGYYR